MTLAGYARMARVINERTLPLVSTLLAQAATGEPDLRRFATTIETKQATGTSKITAFVADLLLGLE